MLTRVRVSALAVVVTFVSQPLSAVAALGPTQVETGVKVQRIYTGHVGATYVSFSPWLPGCLYPGGGYLTVTWDSASGGPSTNVDLERTKQFMSLLLFAKATDTAVEIRYRLNTGNPTGWNSCTIDAVFVE